MTDYHSHAHINSGKRETVIRFRTSGSHYSIVVGIHKRDVISIRKRKLYGAYSIAQLWNNLSLTTTDSIQETTAHYVTVEFYLCIQPLILVLFYGATMHC